MLQRRELFGLAGCLGFSGVRLCAADTKDPGAVKIAEEMMTAMGGREAWGRAPFVRFDFIVTADGKRDLKRSHLWSKQDGRYRIESKTKDGKPLVFLFNLGDRAGSLSDRAGSVFRDNGPVAAAESAAMLKEAYGWFINDMYWLSMPWKWLDEGVNLKLMGEAALKGKKFKKVQLTFGKVGLTPGDRYLAFVSEQTRLMEHWEYQLQSGQKGIWDWEYATTEGVKLAKDHISPDGKSINMGDVKILKQVDVKLFSDPAGRLPG